MDAIGRIVIYHKGKRIERKVPRADLKQAATQVKELKTKGVKAHLVYRTDGSTFPPVDEIDENMRLGRWWCPYCRAWRFFTTPNEQLDAQVGTDAWYLTSMALQGIKCCQWCHISENEWYVKKANGLFHESQPRKRRKRR